MQRTDADIISISYSLMDVSTERTTTEFGRAERIHEVGEDSPFP